MDKMSDKTRAFAPPTSKPIKSKRLSTVSVASSCRKVPSVINKEKTAPSCSKNRNTTTISDHDLSIMRPKASVPNFDTEYKQIAYGKFLRSMLEECLLDEKIEREETQMDIQMTLLADRFQKTTDHLDKTNKRLKEIKFVVEQKRLLDLKNQDCNKFCTTTQESNAAELLEKLQITEQVYLDKLQTKNIDFGYDTDSGHKQLLDAVNDAIEGLEQIKKHSNLDMDKFQEYERAQKNLQDLDKERIDLENLKTEFERKFPSFSEKLIKEASERIGKMIDDDGIDDD